MNVFYMCTQLVTERHSDRVRAIALAMGFTPIIWTGVGNSNFDTDDWHIVSIYSSTVAEFSLQA